MFDPDQLQESPRSAEGHGEVQWCVSRQFLRLNRTDAVHSTKPELTGRAVKSEKITTQVKVLC